MDRIVVLVEWLGRYSVEVSTTATAIFTGLMAWVAWRQSRSRIIAEWSPENPYSQIIRINFTVRNGLKHSIRPWRVKAGPKKLIKDVQLPGRGPKHESWSKEECNLAGNLLIEPGNAQSFSFSVTPDWEEVHRQQSRWHARARTWFARVAWKSLSARVHHGASVHFHVTIDSNVSTSFRKRIKSTIRLTLAAAEKNITPKDTTSIKS